MSAARMTARLSAQVAREIDALRGDRVRSVHQDGPDRWRLDLRGPGRRTDLVLDLDRVFPHVRLAAARPAAKAPAPLAAALRKRLAGARLAGARAVPGERALCLSFTGPRAGDLWIELFGAQANWYLLSPDGQVALTPRGEVARRREARVGAAFAPVPPRPDASPEEVPEGPTGSAAVEALARTARPRRPAASPAGRLRRFLERRRARAQRACAAADGVADLERKAAAQERRGELLRASFHLLRPGAREVTLPDPLEPEGAQVRVELDPRLSPGEQVARCFEEARRARRAARAAERRAEAARGEEQALADALARLEPEAGEEAARAVVGSLPETLREAARRALAPRPGAARPTRARPWRTYRSADGWRILVGRDARGNDELTLHHAAPGDLFLHVRAASGSHVIVPTPRGKTVPKETLLDAAELACHFSARRRAERNEVDYVPRRHVRKPRGSPPGAVVLQRAHTLSVRRDEARRRRLLRGKPG
jgi:predicted ribosome quality control (RQC) complex YloA/Tae2 family protein